MTPISTSWLIVMYMAKLLRGSHPHGELWPKDYLGDLFFNRSAIRRLCLSGLTLILWT